MKSEMEKEEITETEGQKEARGRKEGEQYEKNERDPNLASERRKPSRERQMDEWRKRKNEE